MIIRRLLLVMMLVLFGGCEFFQMQDYRASALVDEDGHPSATLLRLLEETNVEHDGTLKGIVAATQTTWLRPAGSERWQVTEKFADKRAAVLRLITELGMVRGDPPQKKTYKYALVFGALIPSVRIRFEYLISLWKTGVRFEEIVFLGGQRPLDSERENKKTLLDADNAQLPFSSDWKLSEPLPKKEIDMMRMVWSQAELPAAMKKIKTTFINVPMLKKEDGTERRPNTHDTIIAWTREKPEPGTCLAISSQPYVGFQESVIKTAVSQDLIIEAVGPGIRDASAIKVAILLDTCARWVYQEEQRMHARVMSK